MSIEWEKIKSEEDSVTWFGHSAFLLSIDNKKLFVDPMLGPVASPVSFVGSKRFSRNILHTIDEMPFLDAVFITPKIGETVSLTERVSGPFSSWWKT